MNEQEKFAILKSAATITFRHHGAWLFDTWQAHNEQYFGGCLAVVPITFGLLPHGKALGQYHHIDEFQRIILHTSLLEPKGNAWEILPLLGQRYASDVLLHEMVHQSIFERHGHDGSKLGGNSSHNNPAWCGELNRLSPMLGLIPNAKMTNRKREQDASTGKTGKPVWFVEDGYLSRDELAHWPHSVTSTEFYQGKQDSR